jgi:hypothetical protein
VLPLDVAEFAVEFGLAELSVPLDDAELAAEFGSSAELSEPPFGPEGAVIPALLLAAAPLLGVTALFGAVLPLVEPMVPGSWANATGARAATDNAKPAPSK